MASGLAVVFALLVVASPPSIAGDNERRASTPMIDDPDPERVHAPAAALTDRGVWIRGTVTERFREAFVLKDASGQTLIEFGPGVETRSVGLRSGQEIEALVSMTRHGVRARLLEIDGRTIDLTPRDAGRDGPPREIDAAELSERLAELGYRVSDEVRRGPRHYEVAAINPWGESVELYVDLSGQVFRERHVQEVPGE